MFTKLSALALFAGIAAAIHTPVGDPEGNPITRPLLEVVPACKPFTIEWDPTTTNTVSLQLLKGPSTNAVPFSIIVEGIENSGSFVWTPSGDLEPTADATGYGIQLIDDITGQYQYSTQFGISTDDCEVVPSSTPSGYPTVTPSETKTPSSSAYPTAPANSTTFCTTTTKYVPVPTGTGHANSTVVYPTKSMTIPESLKTTATAGTPTGGAPSGTSTGPPESTGAASALKAGFGLAGAVAAAVFML
ncbi:hypothetical protein BU26DRAFT_352021 [Trematosphaeria pertusa]|uniref:Yeast cell wall synthesis Kre9/Knh1-like N-terminal domain-containing protein n=1 Tax=Trematosphaeria pertusa TaxID=390896 RepID=A0A6A6IBC5_9PLEO|nr:uncharacterized protein BU26DRAFT_352021 [Trematosphaeria pertusa]KAF2247691.1 hypothetical protein BU26DRAFT_352021 [Trematosphaeria pertusa]